MGKSRWEGNENGRMKGELVDNLYAKGSSMRRTACWLKRVSMVVAFPLVLSFTANAMSQTSGSSQATNVIHGDVLNIEGETYTVKDKSGHEVAFRVDSQTRQEDRIKVGDKVEAQVSSDGHAQTIRVAIPNDLQTPSFR